MKTLFIIFVLAMFMESCQWFTQPDQPLEEIAEEIIKDELHVSVDLTPSTPEK